jgi:hypothetical protein
MQTNLDLKNETKNFQKNWISQIKENLRTVKSGQPPQLSVWEGYEGCREISEAHDLWVVLPRRSMRGYPFVFLTEKLSREVYLYKWYVRQIVPTNLGFKKAIDALTVVALRLRRTEATESVAVAGLAGDLNRCSFSVEKTLSRLKRERESHWQVVLSSTPAERRTWPVHVDNEYRVHRVPPDHLAKRENVFKWANYPKDLLKRVDLDRRFQVRVATILRLYLSQHIPIPISHRPKLGKFLATISLKTIARLTVLTYVAGNLGREDDNGLMLDGRKKPINVRSVDEMIRKAGLE